MKNTSTERYFLFILIALVAALTLAIFYPFMSMIILACSFSIVLEPFYSWTKKNITRNRSALASLITTTVFVLVLCIPLFTVSTLVFKQIQHVISSVNQNGNTSFIFENLNNKIVEFVPNGFDVDVQSKISEMTSNLSTKIAGFFTSMVRTLILFTLMIISIFYILKNSTSWKETVISVSPLKKENTEEILFGIKKSINQIIKGSLFIAVVQGLLTSLGFMFFGIPNPALWGILAAIASFIPSVGTSLVSVPAIVYLLFNGMNIQALGLLAWSVLLIGMVDNILSPYLISKNTEISSLFTLFAILGGITLLGPIGIIVGPLVLSIFYSLIKIYKKEEGIA